MKEKEVDILEIDLPTNFLHHLRSFLDWEMDRVKLINNPTHLFSLHRKMILVYRPLQYQIFYPFLPFLLKGKVTTNYRILQSKIMLTFQMLSKYIPEP